MSWVSEDGYPRGVAESICHVFNRTGFVREGHATFVVDNPFTWDDLGRTVLRWCEIRQDGLWLRSQDLDGPNDPMHWNPAAVVRGVSPLSVPLLPFPFYSNQLAAFMLAGVGSMLSSVYGAWESGPDEGQMTEVSKSAVRGVEVLKLAYTAFRQSEERIAATHPRTERHSPEWVDLMARDLLTSAPVVLDDASAAAAEWGDRFWQRVFSLRDRVHDWDAWLRMPVVTLARAAFLLSGMSPNMERETTADALITEQLVILARDGKDRALLDWVHDLMELEAGESKPRRYGMRGATPAAASTAPADAAVPEITDARSGGECVADAQTDPLAEVRAWNGVWPSVGPYLVKKVHEWRPASAKEFYQALWDEAKGSSESPFIQGSGADRGGLVIRETSKPLNLKTIQNRWSGLRAAAQRF